MEEYKDMRFYEEIYKISPIGNIINKKNGKQLPRCFNKKGYVQVNVNNNGEWRTKRVHRLILETYCPIADASEMSVNHINGIRDDNRLENLEWVSNRENASHSTVRQEKRTSNYPGVCFSNAHRRYIAQVYFNKKNVYLGLYGDEKAAHQSVLAFHKQNNIINKYI